MNKYVEYKNINNLLDPIVEKLINEGNYHTYHFLDMYSDINIRYVMDIKETESQIISDDVKKLFGIKLVLSYNGYIFLIR